VTSPLRSIIVVADPHCDAPTLACHDHPEWWADTDAENVVTVLQRAVEHLREDHRKHVDNCMCRDRVTDQRCLPRIDWAEVAR
jgi:hypothetical protein